jgi:hypothetical protein
MTRLLEELQYDLRFIRSHTLQPKWYKVLKVFILLGFLLVYLSTFGWVKTVIFLSIFLFLSFLVHMLYRTQTKRWERSWLDFIVVEENGEIHAESIGKFYYSAVLLNAILALVLSQVLG